MSLLKYVPEATLNATRRPTSAVRSSSASEAVHFSGTETASRSSSLITE